MLKVGLTGSIAVGKSFVCSVLAELGCRVLDADQTARDVVEPGSEGLKRIVKEFGRDILTEAGELNRKALGSIIFADEAKRQLLNSILHPLIIEAQNDWIAGCEAADPNGIALIDAALMIETESYKRFDELVVVWCTTELQLARLMKRNEITQSEAEMMIAAQMPQDEKKGFASFLINTSGSFEQTRENTEKVFFELKKLVSGD